MTRHRRTQMITITLELGVAQETLIALRDRAHLLQAEVAAGASGEPGAAAVANIARRQLERVLAVGTVLAAECGESF